MTDRLKLSLGGMWLIAGLAAVVLPVFLPSFPTGGIAGNPIAMALTSMFLLSLPSSLLAIPLAYFIDTVFGVASTPVANLYLYVLTLFVLGAVQWFWLVPRVFRRESMIQTIELSDPTINISLPEADLAEFDLDGATRLERVLVQDHRSL